MSFCPECGAKSTDHQRFCASCGRSLVSSSAPTISGGKPKVHPPTHASSSGVSVLRIAVGVVLGLGLIWVFLPGLLDSKSSSPLVTENRRSPLVQAIAEPQVHNEEITLKEDEIGGPGFNLNTKAKVTITIKPTKGPKIDVYLVSKEGYEQYRAAAGKILGGGFRHFEQFEGTVGKGQEYERSAIMNAGSYVVLLDNTDFGSVSPPANFSNDVIEAAVKIKIE